jgi:hypothetical protein
MSLAACACVPPGTKATFSPVTSGGATTPGPGENRSTEEYAVTPKAPIGPASSKNVKPSMTSPGNKPSCAAVKPTSGGGAADGGIGPDGIKMSPPVAGIAVNDTDGGSRMKL